MWIHLRKRRWYYFTALVVVLAAAVGFWWFAPEPSLNYFSHRDFDRIQVGMQQSEAFNALRPQGPPGSKPFTDDLFGGVECTVLVLSRPGSFFSPPAHVTLTFNDGKVAQKEWTQDPLVPHLWSQIKQRLGL